MLTLKRLLVPGFPVTPISACFIGTAKTHRSFNTLRSEPRLVRGYQRATVTGRGFVTAFGVSLEIDLPPAIKRGPHLDLEVLQWSRLLEIWGA